MFSPIKRYTHKLGITGKGVTVVVIDSGVRTDYSDLKGKVIKKDLTRL